MEESYAPVENSELRGESPSEVTQPLTRLASTGTAACRLAEAFEGEPLAAAMEAKPQPPRYWHQHGEPSRCPRGKLSVGCRTATNRLTQTFGSQQALRAAQQHSAMLLLDEASRCQVMSQARAAKPRRMQAV